MGILDHFSCRQRAIYNYWGLPMNFPGMPYTFHTLVTSLAWGHKEILNKTPPRRREGFPSFCWAGWEGVATLPDSEFYTNLRDDLKNLPRPLDQELLPRENSVPVSKDYLGSPYLDVEAQVVQIQLRYLSRTEYYEAGFYVIDSVKSFNRSPRHLAQAVLSRRPLPGQELFQRLQSQHWECLFLSAEGITYTPSTLLVILERHGEIYERIGVVWGYSNVWEFVKSLPKEIRKIRLG